MLHAADPQPAHAAGSVPLKIWVLAPVAAHSDEHLSYYYDFSQSIAEYERVFSTLQLPWQWQEVNPGNYRAILAEIAAAQRAGACCPVVLNLCDGDEINGTPGISVLEELERLQLIYTGAEAPFYRLTTSKIEMKQALQAAGVPTPNWQVIHNHTVKAAPLLDALGTPVIIKPAVSGGSMGVGTRNVISDQAALDRLIPELKAGYRGWDLFSGGLIAESFIDGPEFTCFLTGDYRDPEQAVIYPPVERVFHASLPAHEKFLSFERLWEIYESESAMPGQDHFYEYAPVEDDGLDQALRQLSWQAYAALQGTGYTRVDIRQDRRSGQLYVLEANAQCGISEDENYTSIGAILRFAGCSFSSLVSDLLNHARQRAARRTGSSQAETLNHAS